MVRSTHLSLTFSLKLLSGYTIKRPHVISLCGSTSGKMRVLMTAFQVWCYVTISYKVYFNFV